MLLLLKILHKLTVSEYWMMQMNPHFIKSLPLCFIHCHRLQEIGSCLTGNECWHSEGFNFILGMSTIEPLWLPLITNFCDVGVPSCAFHCTSIVPSRYVNFLRISSIIISHSLFLDDDTTLCSIFSCKHSSKCSTISDHYKHILQEYQ